MSVASRVADGWVQRAAWYYEHGYGIQALYDAWNGYGPGENVNTLNNIWNAGIRAESAGRAASDPSSVGNIPLGNIPGKVPGANGFCYGVLANFTPSNGLASQPIYFSYTSAFQMSYSQLEDAARGNDPAAYSAAMGGRKYGPADVTWTLESVQVLSLTRC